MTDTVIHTSFLGVPIDGDITRGSERANQRPQSEFEPLVRALLDDPTIMEFGWYQYTPYFNDGEPCVFSAAGLWVRTDTDQSKADDDDEEEDDTERLSVGYGHPSLGEFTYDYSGDWPNRVKSVASYEGPDRDRLQRCVDLDDAIDSGAFDDVLLNLFGDHCEVTVTRTNIQVDFYDHD